MKKIYLIFSLLITINSIGQINHGGLPYSFSSQLSNFVPLFTTEKIDITPFVNEDKITDQHKDIPWRFGIEIPVNLTLLNSGLWENLPDGSRVWRLSIQSPEAKSINLNYSSFYLPQGASFFVYNGKSVLGAFTNENNKSSGEFATTLIKGDLITLEYYEPASEYGNGIIQVSGIVRGYRDLYSHLKSFGSSGGCNVNAVCDTNLWGNEIRSVVMLLTAGNSRFCSGSLVNNTLQDGTPYILTANHCNPSTNNIFMFNYQSSDCSNSIDGSTSQTVVGCSTIANYSPSDFFLVKLSSTPPSNYNVYYSGWSNLNTSPLKGTGIHHPSGDVKKISHDFDQLVEDGYYTIGNDHWKVNDWNTGTTEGGSSGSPLFDQNHRIVGQLHGGDAACGNNSFDYYGKFAVSWATDADTLKQLKHWLDPNNSGATFLDGYDPNGASLVTDAVLLDVNGIPDYVCGDSINPIITIRNNGNSSLTLLNIDYKLDGSPQPTYSWSGNLAPYAIDYINLPTLSLTSGNHTFNVNCSNPNATSDQNTLNDSSNINFFANIQPLFATLNLTTDNFGAESSWIIRNSAGQIIIESAGYPSVNGGQNFIENICLYDGCFTFVFKDSWGDGFCCGANGNGLFLLTEDATGDTLAIDSTFSTDSVSYFFCMGNANGIKELSQTQFEIYPNPNNGQFNIKSSKSIKHLFVYDVLGNIIYSENNLNKKSATISLENKKSGIYLVLIKNSDQEQKTLKIVVE